MLSHRFRISTCFKSYDGANPPLEELHLGMLRGRIYLVQRDVLLKEMRNCEYSREEASQVLFCFAHIIPFNLPDLAVDTYQAIQLLVLKAH